MNINKLFSWGNQDKAGNINNPEEADTFQEDKLSRDNASNVIQLESAAVSNNTQNIGDGSSSTTSNQNNEYKGLLGSPELVAFFKHNYYGLGQHNGRKLLSLDDLQVARESLISDFQNNIASLIQQKQNRLNRIKSEIIAIDGLSDITTTRLHMACDHTLNDINELKDQFEKANDGKGWVLDALNRYQIGFVQGMRETLEFKYLLG